MNRQEGTLYSVLLELQALHEAQLPTTMGHQIHAMFHQLLSRVDSALSARLHDEPGHRPFTLSPLLGGTVQGDHVTLHPRETYQVRVTLLDGGHLWDCLSTLFLEGGPCEVRLGQAKLLLTRLVSTPNTDSTGWAGRTSWQDLVSMPTRSTITLSFTSPTAFNMSGNYFALVPEPTLVWESLIRTWNNYTPEPLCIERQVLQDTLRHDITISACDLSTHTLHYPKYTQKGFTGTCTYHLPQEEVQATQLTCLAAFARFAGVGYKTTMGMGQTRMERIDEKD
jgi:CRISPR-associated endoribonuclease Cas6